jgi:DNA-binding response OmpR family regulator
MVAPAKVLVIEDEPELRDILIYNLTREGFTVIASGDGYESLQLAQRERPDVVLLDLMLPSMDGWQVCRRLRATQPAANIHIIIVSARDAEEDVLRGLELGADDYIRKPFRLKEIVARVKTVLRRAPLPGVGEKPGEVLRFPPLLLNTVKHEARLNDAPLSLTATEYRLLHFLMEHPERIFTRPQLLAQISAHKNSVTGRNIDVHVRSLRRKLGAHAALIDTARGVGYRFCPTELEIDVRS